MAQHKRASGLPAKFQSSTAVVNMDKLLVTVKSLLKYLGLSKTAFCLETEAQLPPFSYPSEIALVRDFVEEGDWNSLAEFLKIISQVESIDSMLYAIRKQQLLECLDQNKPGSSSDPSQRIVEHLQYLQQRCPSDSEYEILQSLSSRTNLSQHPAFANWDKSIARMELFNLVGRHIASVIYTDQVNSIFPSSGEDLSTNRLVVLVAKGQLYEHCEHVVRRELGSSANPHKNGYVDLQWCISTKLLQQNKSKVSLYPVRVSVEGRSQPASTGVVLPSSAPSLPVGRSSNFSSGRASPLLSQSNPASKTTSTSSIADRMPMTAAFRDNPPSKPADAPIIADRTPLPSAFRENFLGKPTANPLQSTSDEAAHSSFHQPVVEDDLKISEVENSPTLQVSRKTPISRPTTESLHVHRVHASSTYSGAPAASNLQSQLLHNSSPSSATVERISTCSPTFHPTECNPTTRDERYSSHPNSSGEGFQRAEMLNRLTSSSYSRQKSKPECFSDNISAVGVGSTFQSLQPTSLPVNTYSRHVATPQREMVQPEHSEIAATSSGTPSEVTSSIKQEISTDDNLQQPTFAKLCDSDKHVGEQTVPVHVGPNLQAFESGGNVGLPLKTFTVHHSADVPAHSNTTAISTGLPNRDPSVIKSVHPAVVSNVSSVVSSAASASVQPLASNVSSANPHIISSPPSRRSAANRLSDVPNSRFATPDIPEPFTDAAIDSSTPKPPRSRMGASQGLPPTSPVPYVSGTHGLSDTPHRDALQLRRGLVPLLNDYHEERTLGQPILEEKADQVITLGSERDAPSSLPSLKRVGCIKDKQVMRSIAFGPRGKLVAIGASSHCLKICSAESLASRQPSQSSIDVPILYNHPSYHSGSIYCLAWSEDCLLASGSNDQFIRLLRADPHEGVVLNAPTDLHIHDSTIRDVLFLNNNTLASAGSGENLVKVTDCVNQSTVACFKGHSAQIFSLSTTQFPNIVLSTGQDKVVNMWDVNTGRPANSMSLHSSAASSHVSGTSIAFGCLDGSVCVYDCRVLNSASPLLKCHIHSGECRSVRFSPDGRFLLSGSYDHTMAAMDVRSSQWKTVESHKQKVIQARWHSSGLLCGSCSVDKTAQFWKVTF